MYTTYLRKSDQRVEEIKLRPGGNKRFRSPPIPDFGFLRWGVGSVTPSGRVLFEFSPTQHHHPHDLLNSLIPSTPLIPRPVLQSCGSNQIKDLSNRIF